MPSLSYPLRLLCYTLSIQSLTINFSYDFGGAVLGIGVGIVLRYGGSLDGTEILSILVHSKLPFSVGEIVMFINFFIFGIAGFVFTWESALFSVVAYFIASK